MKKIVAATLSLLCAMSLAVHAQDAAPKPKMTDEQKAVMKEMLGKYDENKDGKLSKAERAKMSDEDKAKFEKAGLPLKKKKDAAATDKPADTTK